MGILGIAIQSHTGIPLFLESWSEKLRAFREGNPILIAGFISALSSFVSNYRQDIGYIRFRPMDFPDDKYGIDGIYSFLGDYMILCFTDPYQFHRQVHYKMKWIYNKIFIHYEKMIRVGRVPVLSDEEMRFIQDILMDNFAWKLILTKQDQLSKAADNIMHKEYPGDVYGCFITSFDNSILFQRGMEREAIETYINNIGSKGANLQEGEILYNYVTLPGLAPRLVIMKNSGIKIEISDIIGDSVGEGAIPFYYYMITDANCSIGPIIESLTEKFNPILL